MSDDSDNEAEGTPETPDYKARFLSWATGKIGKILPESWVRSSPVYQDSTRVEQAHHTKQIAAFRNGKNAQIETANAGKTAAEARSTELEKTVEKLTAAKTAAETKNTALTEENTALETKMEVTKKSAQNYAGLAKAQREKATALVRVVEASRQMLDEIPKPVLMLDPDLNIVRANQAFREEFGYDPRVVERGSKDVPLSSIVTNPYNLKRLGALAKIFMPLPDVPLGFQIPLKMRPSDRKKSWGTHLWFGNSRYHVANARVTINKRGEFVEAYLALGEELGNREVKRRAHEFQANREFRIGASEVIEYGTAEDYMRKMIHAYAFDFADSRPKEETPASIIVDMHDTKELLIDALYALRQMYMFSQSDEGRHISLSFTDVPYDITCMMQAAGIKMVEQAPQPESAKAQEKKVYVSQPIPAPVPLPLWT